MPGPHLPPILLTPAERDELESLARARTTGQQLAQRARVVLLAARGLSTSAIARELHLEPDTARQWRRRWTIRAGAAEERLADAPKPGRPARFSAEQVCRIVALACERPADSDRPISHWSDRELADESVRRGIVDRISPRHVGRVLKSRRPAAPPDPVLAHAGPDRTGRRAGPED